MRLEQWFYAIPLRLRSLFRRAEVERELDEELRYHVQRATEENLGAGMQPIEARTAALRRFGGLERHKEDARDQRGVSVIENSVRDLRYGWRTLLNAPVFTAVDVLTLALGIGATSTMFTIVNGVLPLPLPYQYAGRRVSSS